MFLPILSAVILIIAFNTKFYFLVFFALAPFFLFLLREEKIWKMIAGAVLFRLIFVLGATYFVIDPILYFLSILIFVGLPISFYLAKKYLPFLAAFLLLPFLWVFWDYLEAQYSLLPVTIMMLGNPLADSPFLGLAGLGGIISLTFFAVFVNFLIVFLYRAILEGREKSLKYGAIILSIFLIVGWQISSIFLKANERDYDLKNKFLNIVLLSADKSKYDFDNTLANLDISEDADLLVVPENFYKSNLDNSEAIIDFYKKIAGNLKLNLSTVTLRNKNGKSYKSSILFSGEGEILDIYDKAYLTITSEYWPFKNWRPFYFDFYLKKATLEEKRRAIFDEKYQLEKGEPHLIIGKGFSFVNPICIEFHYPWYVKKLVLLNPDFIIHNSNNSWIKVGLPQYLRLTNNLRAIQAVWLKKPILVSGIADFSGVFYPSGKNYLMYPEKGIVLNMIKIRL